MGTSQNTLYITWRRPLWEKFESGNGQTSMQVKNMMNGAKKSILETLLYIGCKQASELYKNKKSDKVSEEAIVLKIFEVFEGLKVKRAREGTKYRKELTNGCMGYWRGKSSLEAQDKSKFRELRSVRFLLREGEARCGEWTNFFLHILLTQGIDNCETVAIATSDMADGIINDMSIKGMTSEEISKIVTNHLRKQNPKVEVYEPYIEYTSLHKEQKSLIDNKLEGYQEFFIMIKECEFVKGNVDESSNLFNTNNPKANAICNSYHKKSKAQGNDDAINVFGDHIWVRHKATKRFYDASYGVSFSQEESTLKNYLERLTDGILFIKQNHNGLYLYIRHCSNPFMFLNKLKIDYQIVNKNSFIYLHTTKKDI